MIDYLLDKRADCFFSIARKGFRLYGWDNTLIKVYNTTICVEVQKVDKGGIYDLSILMDASSRSVVLRLDKDRHYEAVTVFKRKYKLSKLKELLSKIKKALKGVNLPVSDIPIKPVGLYSYDDIVYIGKFGINQRRTYIVLNIKEFYDEIVQKTSPMAVYLIGSNKNH